MEVVITAVGPDNVGLADPIIHYVTERGASIAEIQMYDHDEEALFAMLCRIRLNQMDLSVLRSSVVDLGSARGLSVRVWSPDERADKPRLAVCTTYRPEPAIAVLQSVADGTIGAEVALMIGNRGHGAPLAAQHGVAWQMIGDDDGNPDESRFETLLDEYDIDYVVLARYMRILPPATCWKFAGGRIINLHHGLLPGFPGMRPYRDAFQTRMLTYGATCHFIVPELDAGNQIVNQSTFTVEPGTELKEIMRWGQEKNEPACLVEGVRRIVNREVQLHFHRVIARPPTG
jgi:formyltetrahydrofolate deformylase